MKEKVRPQEYWKRTLKVKLRVSASGRQAEREHIYNSLRDTLIKNGFSFYTAPDKTFTKIEAYRLNEK